MFGSVAEGECRAGTSAAFSRPRLTPPSSEREASEGSSGEEAEQEAELEAEPEPEAARDLQPGALLYRASKSQNLPVMAEALAHGADVNTTDHADGGRTPLIQAVVGVSARLSRARPPRFDVSFICL